MNFPVFRKYSHNRTFFKINSDKNFEELNLIGKTYTLRHFEVKIFSDRVFIQDMIENKDHYWTEISEGEYEEKKAYCLEELKPL